MDDITGEQFGTAWEISNRKGTKEKPYGKGQKIRDMQQELGIPLQDAERLYKLMGEDVSG